MTNFGEQPPDPMRVFTKQYWGEVHDMPPLVRYSQPANKQIRAATILVGNLTPDIVSGKVQSQPFEAGRFNPSDPDLARTSAMNMPGSVLLTDYEQLIPYARRLSPEQFACLEDEGDRDEQSSTPRQLIRACNYELSHGGVGLWKGFLRYSTDQDIYRREVRIAEVVPNRQGTGTLMNSAGVTPSPNETSKRNEFLLRPAKLNYDGQIGETYERSAGAAYRGLVRLRSVEVCMSGQPAEARSPSLVTRLAGRLATNS